MTESAPHSKSTGESPYLDILREGVGGWNEWRAKNSSIMPDLIEADLHGAYLSKANLQRVNLSKANLREADLSEADLSEANLSGADLYRADLSGGYLSGADLSKANLQRVVGLTQKQIEQAFGDETTTLPRHLKRPVVWPLRARAGNLRGAANDTVALEDQLNFCALC